MIYLKELLANISNKIIHRNIIYLDYPVHLNVGDLLIYKGTMAFFKENGYKLILAQSVNNFNIKAIKKILETESCSIVLHGGGNFGGLYEIHQKLQMKV
jgi:pyruvyl transferase EpsO